MQRTFGKTILKLRQKRSLSLRVLAFDLAITNSYVSKLEKSTRLPSIDLFFKIADYFELNPLKLLQKCNNLPEAMIRETKLKIYNEGPYEARIRATAELDPKLKSSCLSFDQLLKYVQKKAKKDYHKRQNKRIKADIRRHKSLKRLDTKNSSSRSKKTQKSHQENDSGGEAESDEAEPPINSNLKFINRRPRFNTRPFSFKAREDR